MAKENYTTYTEFESSGDPYLVEANLITITDLPRNIDAYVYDDKGVDHFGGDFDHLVDCQSDDSGVNNLFFPWMLANTIDDWNGVLADTGESFLSVMLVENFIRINECIGSGFVSDEYTGSYGTPCYLNIVRDEAVGTYGTLYCYIYSDAARTILLDTLSLTLRALRDFRYVYGVNNGNNSQTQTVSGFAANLDLQEVVAGVPIFRRRMEGY